MPMIETEICVIGGGPAGSTIARKLALLGHQVCLVEKEPFPRSHIGESLPPSILPVLELAGVRADMEAAGFFRPQRSLIRWSSASATWKVQPEEAGFQVDRGQFDQILLEAAQAVGVQVLQPAHAARPVLQDHWQWLIPVKWQGEQTTIQAQFLVTATGKHRALSHLQPAQPATLAIYGYWRDVPFQGCESRVEAGPDEWFWGAPLPDGRFNAVVFVDRKRFGDVQPCDREQWYRHLLTNTTLLRDCLEGDLDTPLQICDASCYLAEEAIGQDWIHVGNAAFAIDPISSQGVQMAMMSAIQGAIAVHTLLMEPEHSEAAIAFYRQKLQETVQRSQRTAAQIYATQGIYPVTLFWQQRSQEVMSPQPIQQVQNSRLFEIDSRIQLSEMASLILTPVIQGDYIRLVKALHHPNVGHPIAYLGNVAIAPLLETIIPGQTILELMQQWSKQHDRSTSWQLLQWFWSQNIIVLNPTIRHTASTPFEPMAIRFGS